MNRNAMIIKAKTEYERWIKETTNNNNIQQELKSMCKDTELIADAFHTSLEFGTSGIRGILGAGTNRINEYVVRRATQGVAEYMNRFFAAPSVVISYDSRKNSRFFAWEAAKVFSGNNIKTYIVEDLAPVSFLSYAIKKLGCDMGVMITASHNPKEFNGYKVYNSDGYQIIGDVPDRILSEINSFDYFDCFNESKENIFLVPNDIYESFIEENASLSYAGRNVLVKDGLKGLSVVYTPLNGTGRKYVASVLAMIGLEKLQIVTSQEMPDEEFSTCPEPNPEKLEAFTEAFKLLESSDADIIIGTDPDCDRLGICLRDDNNNILLTGSQTGILMMDYLCQVKPVTANAMMIKSIATAPIAERIADKYGIIVRNTLSGFKYVGEIVTGLINNNRKDEFFFAFEETNGYLAEPYIAEKDGVSASVVAVEMTAYYKAQGKTLIQRLNEIYDEYGNSFDKTKNYFFEGPFGKNRMENVMNYFRTEITEYIGDYKVCSKIDYTHETGLPKSNVIQYDIENGTRIIIRPSGTEAKIKVYFFEREQSDKLENCIKNIIDAFKNA